MIQFNLLPAVKQEFIKAQGLKRLMMTVSFIASAAVLTLLIVMLSLVYVVQHKSINDLNGTIASDSSILQKTAHLSDILTVQSQLNSLSTLHLQKPVTSRLFGYLAELTPTQATISDLRLDYTADNITISGNAPSLDVVNTFVDGLKFTRYTIAGSSSSQSAFSTVVLAGFSRSAKSATYSITLSFDPTIFNVADEVSLTVGNPTDTSQQPSIIFEKGN